MSSIDIDSVKTALLLTGEEDLTIDVLANNLRGRVAELQAFERQHRVGLSDDDADVLSHLAERRITVPSPGQSVTLYLYEDATAIKRFLGIMRDNESRLHALKQELDLKISDQRITHLTKMRDIIRDSVVS